MNIEAYINSGNLELYALGRLDPDTTREVELYALEYPEIKAEIEAIELALESFAEAAAKPLSPRLLSPLLAEIKVTPSLEATQEPPVTTPPSATASRSFAWLPWLLALALAALCYYFFAGQADCHEDLVALQQDNNRLEADLQNSQDLLSLAEQRLRDATNPATQGIILAGSDIAPGSAAYVIYNPSINKTYFKATNLPTPPSGKQYQLWAIDASGPKSLGVLDLDLESDTLLEVPFLPDVAAFAITLEDAGGKPTPDLEHLQVIGNVPG